MQLAFDATSAYVHQAKEALIPFGVKMIDLTPAAIGPYWLLGQSCDRRGPWRVEYQHGVLWRSGHHSHGGGGPSCAAGGLRRDCGLVASRSVGPGTATISMGLRPVRESKCGGRRWARPSSLSIRPSRPSRCEHIVCVVAERPDGALRQCGSHDRGGEDLCHGYAGVGPIFEPLSDGRWRISTFLEVQGLGDYLPTYAGNLDIMTAAALRCGELIAQGAKT